MAKPIALAADHGGFELKEAVKAHLDELGLEYIDFGTQSTASVDYPDMALPACDAVVSGQCDKALLFCGTGVGISMAANKVKGIRACCCSDSFSCEYTRRHIGVIHAGSAVGAKVDILQSQLVQVSHDGFLQFKTAMVGGKRNGFCHEKFQSFPFSVSLFRAAASAARRSARSRSAWLRR